MTQRRKTAQAHWPKAVWLEHQLADLSDMAGDAKDAGEYSAAATLKKQLREVRKELDQLKDAEAAADLPETPEEHLLEMLRQTRTMRSQAQTAGSWVAAANLSKRELELMKELAAHRASLKDDEPELTMEDLVAMLEVRLAALPPVVRAKLREQIAA